jgi:plasmid stabilization system protein ParE
VRVRWVLKAIQNLANEAEFVGEDNPTAAADLIERVFEATDRLAKFPDMGRPGRVPGTRELVIAGLPYIIPYRVRAGDVEILRVFHAARKWPENF